MNIIESARKFASEAHMGQFRRDGKTPYFEHVKAVADRLDLSGGSFEEIATAYLHDVIEDCQNVDERTLRSIGMPDSVIAAVYLLTKRKGQDYIEYLFELKQNQIAKTVKIADMLSNLSDQPTPRQIRKYAIGLLELVS